MIDGLVKSFALSNLDDWWQSVCATSIVGQAASALRKATLVRLPVAANLLQLLAFAAVAALLALLVAPQFADDKQGLALIAVGAFVLWICGYFMGGEQTRPPVATDIPVWCYLAANVIAAASSHYLSESLHGLQKLMVYILAYFLFTAVLQDYCGKICGSTKRKFILLTALLLAAVLVSCYGFDQYRNHVAPLATWEDPTVENKGTRIFGTLKNPNLLAGYLLPLVPVAGSLCIAALYDKRLRVKFLGLAAGSAAAVMAVATVLTGSRGAYIGLAVGLGTLFIMFLAPVWKHHPSKRIWLIVASVGLPILAAAVLHFALPTFDQRVLSIFAGSEHSSNAYRFSVYQASWAMLKDNWWLGVGPGNQAFEQAYGLYMRSGKDALGAYCVPLEVAVEAGVLALASFICIVLCALARGHQCFWSADADPGERWLAAGCSAGLLGMMAHGFVDTVFYRPQVQFLFWLLVAFLVVAKIKPANSSK